jgi:hypothetical protein
MPELERYQSLAITADLTSAVFNRFLDEAAAAGIELPQRVLYARGPLEQVGKRIRMAAVAEANGVPPEHARALPATCVGDKEGEG